MIPRGTTSNNVYRLRSEAKEAIKNLPGEIISIMKTKAYRASHRVVQMYSTKPAHTLRPSVAELEFLIAVMRDILPDPSTFKHPFLKHFNSFHHTAPVLMLVVYPGAQARIISGYNDYQTLHIQYSDLKQFTEETFFTEMKELLTWTMPRCKWDTTTPPQMLVFDESEEDEWEAEQWELEEDDSDVSSDDEDNDDNETDYSETDSEDIPAQPMTLERMDSRQTRTDMLRAVRTTMRRERRRHRKNLKIQRDKKVAVRG